MSKTSVIISHLAKLDFVKETGHVLPFSDRIKLAVLNHKSSEFPDLLPLITHWSSLPFLNRIVIILQNEKVAAFVYAFLQDAASGATEELKLPSSVKLLLQENLLQTLKLSDNLNEAKELDVTTSLERFRSAHATGDYREPEPQKSPSSEPPAFLEASDIRKWEINNDFVPPTPPMERSKSITRTLFKPTLAVNTSGRAFNDAPASPTITLDES